MRARKRNPFRGQGLDKRQARRFRRRVAQGKPAIKNGLVFFYDEFAALWDERTKAFYDLMPERIYHHKEEA